VTTSHLPARAGTTRRLLALSVIALALHALGVAAAVAFPKNFGYVNRSKNFLFDDLRLYRGFVSPMLEGRYPYRDYDLEYPVLGVPILAAPLLLGVGPRGYPYAFLGEMLLLDGVLTFLVARRVASTEGIGKVPARLAWYTGYFWALCPLVVLRYDLAPTLMGYAAACWLSTGRMAPGGVAAGLGVLAKLVPGVVMLPVLVVKGDGKPKAVALAAFLVTVGVGGAAWWWFGGPGVARAFRFHGVRGLEIESIPSTAYMVAARFAAVPIAISFDFGGMNLAGPGSDRVARLAPWFQAALLVVVAWCARRAGPNEVVRYSGAAILAFMVAGKVLSPQYLIWLIPFLAGLGGPAGSVARPLFLVCCLLTTAVFPHRFGALIGQGTEAVVLMVLRNLGLGALLVILLGPRSSVPVDAGLNHPAPDR